MRASNSTFLLIVFCAVLFLTSPQTASAQSSASASASAPSSAESHSSTSAEESSQSASSDRTPTRTLSTSGPSALSRTVTGTLSFQPAPSVTQTMTIPDGNHSHSADSSSEASPVYVRGVVVETSLPDGASLLAAISAATNVPRAAMAIVDGNNRPVLTRDALGADSTYRQTRVGFTTVSYYNTAFTAIQAGSVANVRFPTAAPTSAPSGLSNSDKVIIGCVVGIGVPIIILLVVIVVWFYCYRSADGYDKEHTNLEVRDAALVEFDYNNDYVNQGHATIRPRPPAMKKEEEDLL